MPFQEVPNKVDFPAQERETIKFWQRIEGIRAPARAACTGSALVLYRWSDHRQQPDGRPPRLGPHLQGSDPALLDDARPQAALPERLRLPGIVGGGGSRKRNGLQHPRRTSKPSAWRNSCASARRACCATPPCRPSNPSAWAIGWTGTTPTSCAGWRKSCWKTQLRSITVHGPQGPVTGTVEQIVGQLGPARAGRQLLHLLQRKQLHDLDLPQEVLGERLALPRRGCDALVPALRHRHQPARDRHRWLC